MTIPCSTPGKSPSEKHAVNEMSKMESSILQKILPHDALCFGYRYLLMDDTKPRKLLILDLDETDTRRPSAGRKKTPRKLLILDLDETLIHVPDAPFAHPCDFRIGSFAGYKRPGVGHFLGVCQEWFDVAVWSSASADYVSAAVKHLFHETSPVFAWDGRRCTRRSDPETGMVTWRKNLTKISRLGYPLEAVIAVDDSPEKWEAGYGNLVRVVPFLGGLEDDELPALLTYLDALRGEKNVRALEKRGWRHRAPRAGGSDAAAKTGWERFSS